MKQYDIIGIGAGPSNLSLAALAKKTPLNTMLLEKQAKFTWHPGMLLPEAKLQVSYLKDLVTLVDPTNHFSFLSYLQNKECLYQFITAGFEKVYRTEFNDYLEWVFEALDNIEKDTEVLDIKLSTDGHLIVTTNSAEYSTQNVVLGCGLSPHIPRCSNDCIDSSVFHNHSFLPNDRDFKDKEIAVVGGGQSGAEIVSHILNNFQPKRINWFSKRVNFLPIEDSPFSNELYTPKYSKYFYQLSDQDKNSLLDEQTLSSDGISEVTLRSLYEQIYYMRFIKKVDPCLKLFPNSELIEIKRDQDKREIAIKHNETQEISIFKADYVILCTGYRYQQPKFLSSILPLLESSRGGFKINSDYSLCWKQPQRARIFIQNGARGTHGVADPNLSLLAYRSAKILNSILEYPFYNKLEGSTLVEWRG